MKCFEIAIKNKKEHRISNWINVRIVVQIPILNIDEEKGRLEVY